MTPYTKLDGTTSTGSQYTFLNIGDKTEEVNGLDDWDREGNEEEQNESDEDQHWCNGGKHGK
jgi:hypothetical protein